MTSRGTILITDCDHPSVAIERAIMATAGFDVTLRACRSTDDVRHAAAETRPVALLVQYAPISGEILRALPDCRAVGRYGVGLDTIDLAGPGCGEHLGDGDEHRVRGQGRQLAYA